MTKIIIGLGNPGDKYESVRHNLGFMVVDEFTKKMDGGKWKIEKTYKSEIIRIDPSLVLAKPQTFMNNSGLAVAALAKYYKISPQDIIIIHDELDLPLGKIKVRIGGAAGGHHGVESIIKDLGTDQFIRVRLGIGNLKTQSAEHKGAHISAEKFVLEPFTSVEKPKVKHMIKQTIRAVEIILEKGLEKAQNQFN